MRVLTTVLCFGLMLGAASAAEVASVYTDLDIGKHCVKADGAAEGEGDWAQRICQGFSGYPVILSYDDARESTFFGFPPAGGNLIWESFEGFNEVGPKIEWRVQTDGDKKMPFAVIHRWSVASPEDPDQKVEVLVVSKIAQMADNAGCVVGLVLATGRADANETARKIADEQAREFSCGDERTLVGEPMPVFLRQQN